MDSAVHALERVNAGMIQLSLSGEKLLGPAPFQDYQISEFLRKDPKLTWEAAFRGPGPLPDGASRRRFVPRPLAFPKAERTPRAEWIQETA